VGVFIKSLQERPCLPPGGVVHLWLHRTKVGGCLVLCVEKVVVFCEARAGPVPSWFKFVCEVRPSQ
jgi:hypothetical protein